MLGGSVFCLVWSCRFCFARSCRPLLPSLLSLPSACSCCAALVSSPSLSRTLAGPWFGGFLASLHCMQSVQAGPNPINMRCAQSIVHILLWIWRIFSIALSSVLLQTVVSLCLLCLCSRPHKSSAQGWFILENEGCRLPLHACGPCAPVRPLLLPPAGPAAPVRQCAQGLIYIYIYIFLSFSYLVKAAS